MSDHRYLTLVQAVEIVPLAPITLRRAINAGDLIAFKIGRRLLIRPEDLYDWVESRRVTANTPMPKPARCESTTVNLLERAMRERGEA